MPTIIHGNLFNHIEDFSRKTKGVVFIPHVVNDIGVIGGGFTGPLIKKWPVVAKEYRANKGTLGDIQTLMVETDDNDVEKIVVCNMHAQKGIVGHNNPKPIRYEALVECMVKLRKQHLTKGFDRIVTIPFGSGLAGGNKEFIYELMDEIWGNFDVTVFEI
jgi:hypothetical protein